MEDNDEVSVGKELMAEWESVAGGIVEGVGVGVDNMLEWCEWSTVWCECDVQGCDSHSSESESLSDSKLLSELLSESRSSSRNGMNLGSGGKSHATVEYGMLVAKSLSVKMVLSTGQVPLFLNAEMTVDGWNNSCITSMYFLMKSSFGISDPVSSTMQSHWSSQACWNSLKTPTLRGCNLWVVWGRRHKIMILWSSARQMISEVSWEPWPSRTRRIGFPDLFHAVDCRMNDFSNHSAPMKSSVQPFWDIATLTSCCQQKTCNKTNGL